MDASDRIKQAVNYLRFNGVENSHEAIAAKLKRNRANVTKAINGYPRYLTESFLKEFASAYSDYINESWLLTGEGEMETSAKARFRPHIPVEVAAGPMGTAIQTAMADECELRAVDPGLPDYDFTIGVKGDSMIPEIASGDTVACRSLKDPLAEFVNGKIYVIDTDNGAAVKQASLVNGALLCHSFNPAPQYADYTVPLSSILGIHRAVGLIRHL